MVENQERSMEVQGCWHEIGLIKQFEYMPRLFWFQP